MVGRVASLECLLEDRQAEVEELEAALQVC